MLIGTVDLARYAVGHSGQDELGFDEVVVPVSAQCVEVPRQERRASQAVRLKEREHLAQSHRIAFAVHIQENLVTVVEYLPRPRQWIATTSPGKLRPF